MIVKILRKINWNVLTDRELEWLFDEYPELLEDEE